MTKMITANQREGRRGFPPETIKPERRIAAAAMLLLTNEMMSSESLTDVIHQFLKVASQSDIESNSGMFSKTAFQGNSDISAVPSERRDDEVMATASFKRLDCLSCRIV